MWLNELDSLSRERKGLLDNYRSGWTVGNDWGEQSMPVM